VSTTDPIFLDQDQILIIHRHAIVNIGQTSAEDYDATLWVIDFNLLESALFAPQQTFGGAFLYTRVVDMAAAYWFGFAKNHAFIDGNKRVALLAATMFLAMNGLRLTLTEHAAEQITLQLAKGELSREGLVAIVESNFEYRDP
jgi:death on curing protein